MTTYEYIKAMDFDRAWLNFELDLPLAPGKNGQPNPFYISRPGNPINELADAILAPFFRPPKFFFSGHRGCGKSTELLHILSHAEIHKKFWPINFSIQRKKPTLLISDFHDVLLAIGSQMYRKYRKNGGEIPERLLKQLNSWKGKVEQEVKTVLSGQSSYEFGGSLDAFFLNAGMKMKLEPKTRIELRQVFEKDITGLIDVINMIAAAIYAKEKRIPLILIDDMDKPDLNKATAIFHDRREIMMQPNCAIIYTVSSALFYSKEFDAIRDQAIFLPNINLHPCQEPERHIIEGYDAMRQFAHVRMDQSLIDGQALEDAITYSGGVFREMARIMRSAIGCARRRKAVKINQR